MNNFIESSQIAAKALKSIMPETPLQKNAYLSEKYGAEVYLKREDLSPVRSYKLRGAFNAMRKAIDTGHNLFVCASAGNHAQGVAYAAKYFGVKAVIFMPIATPGQKIHKTRVFGENQIEIKLIGDFFDESLTAAKAYCDAHNAHFLAPFDDDDVIEGQATIALEISRELELFDHLVMPVGGGGLAAGLTQFYESQKAKTRFHFVEPEGASSLKESLKTGQARPLTKIDNFVDGASVAQIGQRNFSYLKHFSSDDVISVPENRLALTMMEMLNIEGIVLEPAGALAIDALRDLDIRGKTVVVIVSGGNFDFERLPDIKERAMRYEGTKKYVILRLPQRPGALKDFLSELGPEDDIARFEYMKKSARQFGTVLLGIETTRPENFPKLFARLDAAGFLTEDITENQQLDLLI